MSEEFYRQILWKTKRALEDLLFDEEIRHYVISEQKYKLITDRINKTLGVKPQGKRNNSDYRG